MRRQFSWPTRTWNKDEIANLLAMFYPKSKKYNEYMETVDVLHKNDMMQADLFSAINKMRTKDPEPEFLTIDYTIFRGPMQQRVSGPCSGLGQLLVKSRTRMQFIDLDEVQYIAPRPYGDVRVVDEILALAIHLNLIAYDELNDTLFLTEQGESAVINEFRMVAAYASFESHCEICFESDKKRIRKQRRQIYFHDRDCRTVWVL